MDHVLKCWPEFWEAVANGLKRFEFRRNDRPFAVNDVLVLREYDPAPDRALGNPKGYTGRQLCARVTFILGGGSFGLSEGHVVMSLDDVSVGLGSSSLARTDGPTIPPQGEIHPDRLRLLQLEEAATAALSGVATVVGDPVLMAIALARDGTSELGNVRGQLYEERVKNGKLTAQVKLLGDRLKQLESIVSTALARAVRAMSQGASDPVARSKADAAVVLLTEAIEAEKALDQAGVPGAGLLVRVRRVLLDLVATRTDEVTFAVEAEGEAVETEAIERGE